MRLSIISAVLNSHEVVRRHILHYKRMNLPSDIEVIFVDDGSSPPLELPEPGLRNFIIYHTGDTRDWTEHVARNKGAAIAKGKYLTLIDIDYILPRASIIVAYKFDGDKMNFRRRFGVLDEDGNIVCDRKTLRSYRLRNRWLRGRAYPPGHRSQFTMRRDLFWEIGGYREDLTGQAHPLGGGAGQKFFRKWQRLEGEGRVKVHSVRPIIFMFPSGKFCKSGDIDYNPFGLFHSLSRKV